jgi:uncharacterized protein YqcC (DUF446 family)
MKEIDDFEPFDTQTLEPMDWYDWVKMKRIVNAIVKEMKKE